MDFIIGGIEGGATHSKAVLYNGKGEKLVQVTGPGTNHWMIGMTECQNRIHSLIEDAKEKANISKDVTLEVLGLSLSGCEQDETNNELREGLMKRYPTLSKKYTVCSDTLGPIAAALEDGGMVLIAGTGSNCLLLNPDRSVHRCGGWGHILGDEGGAWWIAHKAIKVCIDDQDNFKKPPHPTAAVWKTVQEHFNVKTSFDLLDYCYTKFDKPSFAALTQRISERADEKDELALWLFREAGVTLAKHVTALLPVIDKKLLYGSGGLPIVCVGSVWKSWEYLKPGFIHELESSPLEELTLVKLTTDIATGAVYLAAKDIDFDIPRNYEKNHEVLFNYKQECKCLLSSEI